MADVRWHSSDGVTEAFLEVDDDGLELSIADVHTPAEGQGLPINIDAAVRLRNALTDWLYETTGHGWLEQADRG